MKITNIEWADSTVNPVMGCEGCELWTPARRICYAGLLHDRYNGPGKPEQKGFAKDFNKPEMFPGRALDAANWGDLTGEERPRKPWMNGRPRHIFIFDMSDGLSKSIPFEFLLSEVIDAVTCKGGRRHVWLWLTKRPSRMVDFELWLRERGLSWPINLWPGFSATDQRTFTARLNAMAGGDFGKAKIWASLEPIYEEISIDQPNTDRLQWLITGGSSTPEERIPHPIWFLSLKDQAEKRSIPFFFKQWGYWAPAHPPYEDGDRLIDHLGGASAMMRAIGKHESGAVLCGAEYHEMPEVEMPELTLKL